MKIVFSRKGSDSGIGRIPSPIFPDGTFFSLPLLATSDKSNNKFDDLTFDGHPIGKVVRDLSKRKIEPTQRIHFDPDLNPSLLPRLPGWRPIFGPAVNSRAHLLNQGVSVGDIVLFFGWFRQVEHGARSDTCLTTFLAGCRSPRFFRPGHR